MHHSQRYKYSFLVGSNLFLFILSNHVMNQISKPLSSWKGRTNTGCCKSDSIAGEPRQSLKMKCVPPAPSNSVSQIRQPILQYEYFSFSDVFSLVDFIWSVWSARFETWWTKSQKMDKNCLGHQNWIIIKLFWKFPFFLYEKYLHYSRNIIKIYYWKKSYFNCIGRLNIFDQH